MIQQTQNDLKGTNNPTDSNDATETNNPIDMNYPIDTNGPLDHRIWLAISLTDTNYVIIWSNQTQLPQMTQSAQMTELPQMTQSVPISQLPKWPNQLK